MRPRFGGVSVNEAISIASGPRTGLPDSSRSRLAATGPGPEGDVERLAAHKQWDGPLLTPNGIECQTGRV
jgi:hypothetical protein